MRSERITIAIRLRSNGADKVGSLEGYAFVESGFLVGEFPKGPCAFTLCESVLLTAFTFTGCPIAARGDNPEWNPWLKTDGVYEGERHLVAKSFEARSQISATRGVSGIKMDLTVSHKGALPSLRSIRQPFQEHISEVNMGLFGGEFDLGFVDEEDRVVSARAVSRYKLDVGQRFRPVWRNIAILNSNNVAGFIQVEQIDLFADAENAKRDLAQKIEVSCKKP